MKPGFQLTTDLVRFRVTNTPAVYRSLMGFFIDHCVRWVWQDAGDGSVISFVCPKDDAPKVLDILAKHGVERVEDLG